MTDGTGVCCSLVMMDLALMSGALVLFNFRKFLLIQLQMSSRQMTGRWEIDLCVIGIALKMEPMVMEECAQGE